MKQQSRRNRSRIVKWKILFKEEVWNEVQVPRRKKIKVKMPGRGRIMM